MKHRVPHDLQLDLARQVIEHALESYIKKFAEYQPSLSWLDADRAEVSFKALGQTVTGRFCLRAHDVEVDMQVPLMLRPFRKKALEVVTREIDGWIQRARRGEISLG